MSPDAVIANDAPVVPINHGVVTVKKTTTIPLNTEEKTTILLNVESTIKEIVNKIAKREDIEGFSINAEDFPEVPNSLTGVMVHYLVEGLKRDFSVEFDHAPKSLRIRGGGDKYDKKIAGKKRLLTREEKNTLLAKTAFSYYEEKLSNGEITMDGALASIKDAVERKQNFEEMGYVLPPQKTAYPHWKDEDLSEGDN